MTRMGDTIAARMDELTLLWVVMVWFFAHAVFSGFQA